MVRQAHQLKKNRLDTWEDCGNAMYEGYQQPMEKVRHHFHCSQLHFPCKECPVYREKRTKVEKKL